MIVDPKDEINVENKQLREWIWSWSGWGSSHTELSTNKKWDLFYVDSNLYLVGCVEFEHIFFYGGLEI